MFALWAAADSHPVISSSVTLLILSFPHSSRPLHHLILKTAREFILPRLAQAVVAVAVEFPGVAVVG